MNVDHVIFSAADEISQLPCGARIVAGAQVEAKGCDPEADELFAEGAAGVKAGDIHVEVAPQSRGRDLVNHGGGNPAPFEGAD